MQERTFNVGSDTKIVVKDGPGAGGACHKYAICDKHTDSVGRSAIFAVVGFQNGLIAEKGVNGCQQEDLLAIVIDRLQSFQAGPFSCRENALALTKCQEALHWLQHRTSERSKQGVEGTNQRRG